MLDDTNSTDAGMMSGQQYLEGTPVYDAAAEKVGTVSEHDIQGGYLVVHKGIFRKDVYIPLSAIGRGDADGVYLNMYRDELSNQNWDNPPADAGMNAGTSAPMATGATGQPGTALDMGQSGPHDTSPRDGDVAVPLREEELFAQKQQSEAGRIYLHKDVVEEPQSIDVPVTREEINVERVPSRGATGDVGPDAFQERDIEVPVMGEQVTAEKRAKQGEEIRLHKQHVTENQHFGDTVRRERVNVDGENQQGDMDLANSDEQPPANL